MAGMLADMAKESLVSLEIFFLTLLFAIPLALPVAFARMSRCAPLRIFTSGYLLIMRGTPLILQLIFVFYVPLKIFLALNWDVRYDRFLAVIIAFTLNYAAYFAEIYRGGIASIPRGQYEAGKVLGFTKTQTFFRIVLPQVVKRILPALSNEVITLVKDTALASTLAVAELFHYAKTASSQKFSTMPIFIAGVFYFVMNWAVAKAFATAEKKLSYYR